MRVSIPTRTFIYGQAYVVLGLVAALFTSGPDLRHYGMAGKFAWATLISVIGIALMGRLLVIMQDAGLPERMTPQQRRLWIGSKEFISGVVLMLSVFAGLAVKVA